eukprot:5623907-Amphidinium_carterae.1
MPQVSNLYCCTCVHCPLSFEGLQQPFDLLMAQSRTDLRSTKFTLLVENSFNCNWQERRPHGMTIHER